MQMQALTPPGRWALPWPLPALLAWSAGWLLWRSAGAAGVGAAPALALGMAGGLALAWPCRRLWRRAIAALGFPLSALALGLGPAWPAWVWLLLLLPVLLAYPLRAWRDAPFFPTPAGALDGLQDLIGMPGPGPVLDAGCGLGHGLVALRRCWPAVPLHGVEWSPVLVWWAARRNRGARLWRGDMWAHNWAGYGLVYLFQRPESMARAFAKAEQELGPEAWLVSLEFEVPGQRPVACLHHPGQRPVWLYRPAQGKERSTAAQPGR